MARRSSIWIAALVATALVAGCGDDGSSDDAAESPSTETSPTVGSASSTPSSADGRRGVPGHRQPRLRRHRDRERAGACRRGRSQRGGLPVLARRRAGGCARVVGRLPVRHRPVGRSGARGARGRARGARGVGDRRRVGGRAGSGSDRGDLPRHRPVHVRPVVRGRTGRRPTRRVRQLVDPVAGAAAPDRQGGAVASTAPRK